ncbi:MAG: hypothetical protein AB1861_21445 [Cyanobacteriota bacterium]
MDVSTGFRFHFVEILLSAGFRFLQVALIGVSAGTYLIYEFVYQANSTGAGHDESPIGDSKLVGVKRSPTKLMLHSLVLLEF